MSFPFAINGTALDGKADSNGYSLPALKYQGASYSLESVDGSSAGRNQEGKMIRDKIADKVKWQLEFIPCSQAQLCNLLNAVKGTSFSFTYPDPTKSSGTTTGTFYVGARSTPVWMIEHTGDRNVQLWGNVTMNFIEM